MFTMLPDDPINAWFVRKPNAFRFVSVLVSACLFTVLNVTAQFPAFPPEDVSSRMDRDQMPWQLGIQFPSLPPGPADPNAPKTAFPSDPDHPERNWTDDYRHTITRSISGLWNNYDDYSAGFFPGPDSLRTGNYTPIDLLRMRDGSKIISSPGEWWGLRRPEILEDVQRELWGTVPDESILPGVSWTVETSEGGTGRSTKGSTCPGNSR